MKNLHAKANTLRINLTIYSVNVYTNIENDPRNDITERRWQYELKDNYENH
jgi:hypothetical protein